MHQRAPRVVGSTLVMTALILAAALLGEGCGGGGGSPVAPAPTPTPAPVPTPTPTPAPTPSPDAAARCAGLASGPVTRIAVSPRQLVTDGVNSDMMVRVRPGFDEVWCVDKDKEHRLDFNLNQRNANGQACCWENTPEWNVSDPSNLQSGSGSTRDDNGFIYRIRIASGGRKGTVGISAKLDGVDSHPWQSLSGYTIGTLDVVAMEASDIAKDCQCTYKGNGQYEGAKCPK
jgi:hypothetical protein